MKDGIGQELNLGDRVVHLGCKYAMPAIYIVKSFTKQQVRLEEQKSTAILLQT